MIMQMYELSLWGIIDKEGPCLGAPYIVSNKTYIERHTENNYRSKLFPNVTEFNLKAYFKIYY